MFGRLRCNTCTYVYASGWHYSLEKYKKLAFITQRLEELLASDGGSNPELAKYVGVLLHDHLAGLAAVPVQAAPHGAVGGELRVPVLGPPAGRLEDHLHSPGTALAHEGSAREIREACRFAEKRETKS